jgi:succinate dehydrogenase / fumarate reductase flavoprotein subunit
VAQASVDAAVAGALAPFERTGSDTENPYTVHAELQQTMNDLVGIIRREAELREALHRLDLLAERAGKVAVSGGRAFNPGWHLALDLRNMVLVSQAIAMAALERTESRGGHTREDHPTMDPQWRQVNVVLELDANGTVVLSRKPVPIIRPDLLALFDRGELAKYLTAEELPAAGGEEAAK